MTVELRPDRMMHSAYDLYDGDKKVVGWWVVGDNGQFIITTGFASSGQDHEGTFEEATAIILSLYAMREQG
jgi:lysyl-tRNA synthetase class I